MSYPASTKPSAVAFTLIEILVVIAVIGLLAGVLVPVVSQVRAVADAGRCAANLGQCVIAHLAYANDHKGDLPQTSRRLSGTTQIPWPLQLRDYFDTKEFTGNGDEIAIARVAQCPAFRRNAWPVLGYDGSQAWKYWGYVRNNYLYQAGQSRMIEQPTVGTFRGDRMGDWRSASWSEPFRISRITHPSRRFLIGDGSNTEHSVTIKDHPITYQRTNQDGSFTLIAYQYAYLLGGAHNIEGKSAARITSAMQRDAHRGKRTYAMVDGSARRLEDSALNPTNQFFLSIVDPARN